MGHNFNKRDRALIETWPCTSSACRKFQVAPGQPCRFATGIERKTPHAQRQKLAVNPEWHPAIVAAYEKRPAPPAMSPNATEAWAERQAGAWAEAMAACGGSAYLPNPKAVA